MKNIKLFLRELLLPTVSPSRLTPRQREVCRLIAEGSTNPEIAELLGISIKTVEKHRDASYKKAGCRNSADLTRYCLAYGIAQNDYDTRREK